MQKPTITYRMHPTARPPLTPADTINAVKTLTSTLGTKDHAIFIAIKQGTILENYVVVPDNQKTRDAVKNFATGIGARIGEVDDYPETHAPYVGTLQRTKNTDRISTTQHAGDPFSLSRTLGSTLDDGEWLAVTMRPPHRNEAKNWDTWHTARSDVTQTHHTREHGRQIMSMTIGCNSKKSAQSLTQAVVTQMHGFDIDTKFAPHPTWKNATQNGVATAALATAAFTTDIPYTWHGAAVFALATAATAYQGKKQKQALITANLTPPPRRSGTPRKPHKAIPATENTKEKEAFPGDWPLHDNAFMCAPQLFVGVAAPQAGIDSGPVTHRGMKAPTAVTNPAIGAAFGSDNEGHPVRLDYSTLYQGTVLYGEAGSGKTQTLRSLFGGLLYTRMMHRNTGVIPYQLTGHGSSFRIPAHGSTIFAIESKSGTDAAKYIEWGAAMGETVTVISPADPLSSRINFFSSPGKTFAENAARFVDQMVYAWNEGDIGAASKPTLIGVFTAAQGVAQNNFNDLYTHPECRTIAPTFPEPSVVLFAHILLGGYGQAAGKILAETLQAEHSTLLSKQPHVYGVNHGATHRTQDEEARLIALNEAVPGLNELYVGKSDSARGQLQKAPENKVAALMKTPHWWAPIHDEANGRYTTSFDEIVDSGASIVFNVGNTSTLSGATKDGLMLNEESKRILSSMAMWLIKDTIERRGAGEHVKNFVFMSDELSLVAPSNGEVIQWFRDQARSLGVILVVATQRPDQLQPSVRSLLSGFGNSIMFKQQSPDIARELAENVSLGSATAQVSAHDIANLDAYWAIVKIGVGEKPQTPFGVGIYNFESNIAAFANMQSGNQPFPMIEGVIQQ